MSLTKIHLASFNPTLGDVAKNLNRIEEIIKKDQEKNQSDIYIFPELSLSGYLLENLAYENAIHINDARLSEILKLSKKSEIILGSLIKENSEFFNAALVFKEGELIHVQKKIYPPTYGMFDESRYWKRGKSLNIYEGKAGKTGILICEDAWHPILAYALATKKVDNVFVISASPARGQASQNFDSNEMWISRMRVYAQSFGAQYLYINRSGFEDGVYFKGQAIFASPEGTHINEYLEENSSLVIENDSSWKESAYKMGGPYIEDDFILNEILLMD